MLVPLNFIINNFNVFINKKLSFESSKIWDGRIRTSEMAGPKPAALPLGDVPSPCSQYL